METNRRSDRLPGDLSSTVSRYLDQWAQKRVRKMTGTSRAVTGATGEELGDLLGQLLLCENLTTNDKSRDAIVQAFIRLYQPRHEGEHPVGAVRSAIVEQFHRLFYHDSAATWRQTEYRGVRTAKCPLDLWVYQEVLWEVKPELVIEAGTNRGGSAYFLADLCALAGRGRVVTIDVEEYPELPVHERITYLHGSSTAEEVVARVRRELPNSGPVIVILDSDHSEEHVLAELGCYAPMVTTGSYIIVEDTNISGHPVLPSFPNGGPMAAVERFVASNPSYCVDPSREKFMLTFNPRGYLRRMAMPCA